MSTSMVPVEIDEEEDGALVRMDTAVAALNKSEVEAQLDAAHKYKRSLKRFRDDALSMATVNEEVAQSCIYSLPRGGRPISGPSVRLAEICASAWGNIHVGARPVEVGETEVTSQGVAWDLERNFRVTVESKRRITGSNGKRYNDDMIIMTQNAANSIALRNAIFRVIPRAYVDQIYSAVRDVAIGDASTLAEKRGKLIDRLGKMGVDQARLLAAVQKPSIDDIGLEEFETLIGYGTAIKEGTKTVDELFPPVAKDVPGGKPEEQGKRIALKSKPGGGTIAPAANGNAASPSTTTATAPSGAKTAAPAAAKAAPPTPKADPGSVISTGPGKAAPTAAASAPAAATTTPHDPQTGEVKQDFVMSTPKQRKELGEAIFGARLEEETVCKWFNVDELAALSGPQIVDALERIKILEDQGPAAAPTVPEVLAALKAVQLDEAWVVEGWKKPVADLTEDERREVVKLAAESAR